MRRLPPGGGGASGRRRARLARASLALGLLLCAAAALAGGAAGVTSDAEITVSAGSLSITTPDFQPVAATLDGTAQVLPTTPGTAWSAIDARGTGVSWSVVASSTDLVSTGTPNRVIDSASLAITTGAITAGPGADPATGMTGGTAAPFTVPTGPGQTNVTLIAAPGGHRGGYTFTPSLAITLPATAQPSHGGSPYAATLTVTIS
jgi:hypothetical protein